MNKIEVGKTYLTAEGSFRCVHIEGDSAWMVSSQKARPYKWALDGRAINLNRKYNVIWPESHPKVITRTITYPAPETEAPARGTEYFIPEPISGYSLGYTWHGDGADIGYLRQGLVYLTEEDAIARAKAMLE